MSASPAAEKKSSSTCRVLTLTLGKERYAISILNVREIIRPMDISPVPRVPAEYLGVINLRGKIVPVIDLRIKFGLEFTERGERNCIVVVQTESLTGGAKVTGLFVDEVQEVIALSPGDIAEAPAFGSAIDTAFIQGLAKTKGGVTILLDLERLLSSPSGEKSL